MGSPDSPNLTPSVGRIVHATQPQHFVYPQHMGDPAPLPRDERHVAAIITEVLQDGKVWVQIFPPPGWSMMPWPEDGIPFDPEGSPGTWHWPERV